MPPRKLAYDSSLNTIRDELIYTEARLIAHPLAKELAATFVALQERTDAVQAEQRAHRKQMVLSEAGVDAADDALDDCLTGDVSEPLLNAVKRNRTSPRFTRYFKQAPSAFVRLGLESQADAVREWPASLQTEPEPELVKGGEKLAAQLVVADEAVKTRREAFASNSDHRVRQVIRHVDDVNAARLSVFGLLVGMVEPNALPRDWPNRFFRQEVREKGPRTPPEG